MENNKFAILFTFVNYRIVQRWEIDLAGLDNVPVTPESALQILKMARKKSDIRGKTFLLWWKNRLYYVTKEGKDFVTYDLDLMPQHQED